MSIKSDKQFEVIIEKLDQRLEENKQLNPLIAQKDDEPLLTERTNRMLNSEIM